MIASESKDSDFYVRLVLSSTRQSVNHSNGFVYMLCRLLRQVKKISSSFSERKFSSSSRCPVYFLADACHGQGYNLASSVLSRTSSCALLAAVTQSRACETEMKQKFWDGDRILTSTIDLTTDETTKFIHRVEYGFGPVDVLLANCGEVPSRWRRDFAKRAPRIDEIHASEWVRLYKDVAAVGILLRNLLPGMLKNQHKASTRRVIAVFTHQAPSHIINAVALKSAHKALHELVKGAGNELVSRNVTVVLVETPNLQPEEASRWATEVAKALERLRTDEFFASRHNGHILDVDFPRDEK